MSPRTFRCLEEQHYKTCFAKDPEGMPFEGCKIFLGKPAAGRMLPTAKILQAMTVPAYAI